ncbi:hypothetical protein B0J18DRAFT_460042 [Chaetomium sp. MPI-SDFR-AT-0129]|nr:hypothetical protein B0J18DRAFT_460042 [Chaetomium sp. MPI-SDFR-AT-0129]
MPRVPKILRGPKKRMKEFQLQDAEGAEKSPSIKKSSRKQIDDRELGDPPALTKAPKSRKGSKKKPNKKPSPQVETPVPAKVNTKGRSPPIRQPDEEKNDDDYAPGRPPPMPKVPKILKGPKPRPNKAASTTSGPEKGRAPSDLDVQDHQATSSDSDQEEPDEDYIPGRPPPLPKVPKILKGPKRQPKPANTDTGEKAVVLKDTKEVSPIEISSDDHETDGEYVPEKPPPMPKVPKILRGPKKKPRKEPPGPLVIKEKPSVFTDPALLDTPYPPLTLPISKPTTVPPSPPPTSKQRQQKARPFPIPKTNPIWYSTSTSTTGPSSPPHQPPLPIQNGTISCEPCFYNDVLRWLRIRDGVLKVLRLLDRGGSNDDGREPAMDALRSMAGRMAEGEAYGLEDADVGGEDVEGMEDHSGKEEGGGRIEVESVRCLWRKGKRWPELRLTEYPPDVIGLFLLRILTERSLPRLEPQDAAEVEVTLEALRQDIGVGTQCLKAMTVVYRRMLDGNKSANRDSDKPREDGWVWGDEAKQPRSRPAAMLADSGSRTHAIRKSRNDNEGGSMGPYTLYRLGRALGTTIATTNFLQSIGEKLAHARHELQTAVPGKRRRSPDDFLPTTSKRRKFIDRPVQQQDITESGGEEIGRGLPEPRPIPLPCAYCSESGASRRYNALYVCPWAGAPHPQRQRSILPAYMMQDMNNKAYPNHPWTNALQWVFPPSLAKPEPGAIEHDIRTAEAWFQLLASTRDVRVVNIFSDTELRTPLKGKDLDGIDEDEESGSTLLMRLMVDMTGDVTRVVLMEGASIFDGLFL